MAEPAYKDSTDVKSAAKADTTKIDTARADTTKAHKAYPELEILYRKESNPMRWTSLKHSQETAVKNILLQARKEKKTKVRQATLKQLFDSIAETKNWWLMERLDSDFKTYFKFSHLDKPFVKGLIDDYVKTERLDEETRKRITFVK